MRRKLEHLNINIVTIKNHYENEEKLEYTDLFVEHLSDIVVSSLVCQSKIGGSILVEEAPVVQL